MENNDRRLLQLYTGRMLKVKFPRNSVSSVQRSTCSAYRRSRHDFRSVCSAHRCNSPRVTRNTSRPRGIRSPPSSPLPVLIFLSTQRVLCYLESFGLTCRVFGTSRDRFREIPREDCESSAPRWGAGMVDGAAGIVREGLATEGIQKVATFVAEMI